jgi:translocator protein
MKRVNVLTLVLILFVVYAFAFIGTLLTSSAVNSSWYSSIKPSITPPNWVFPVVWNILFLLISLSLYISWMAKAKNNKESKKIKLKLAVVFGINLILNVLWSFFFFTLRNPILSFFELIIFWISILVMIFVTYRVQKWSAYLLVPYALWVAFAGILNYLIAFM